MPRVILPNMKFAVTPRVILDYQKVNKNFPSDPVRVGKSIKKVSADVMKCSHSVTIYLSLSLLLITAWFTRVM